MKSHTTILSIVFGFLLINLFVDSDIIVYFLLLIMAGSLFSQKFSNFIERIWNKIAVILSYIVPNILLTLVFYFVLTPLAFLARLSNSKTDYITNNTSDSVFRGSNREYGKSFFEKPWWKFWIIRISEICEIQCFFLQPVRLFLNSLFLVNSLWYFRKGELTNPELTNLPAFIIGSVYTPLSLFPNSVLTISFFPQNTLI